MTDKIKNLSLKERGLNKCSICNDIKVIDRFKKNRNQCKDCINKKFRDYYYKNYEKETTRVQKWAKKNVELRKKTSRLYYINNTDKIKDWCREYRRNNPDKRNELTSKRRAVKIKAIPEFLKNCKVEKVRMEKIYKLSRLMSEATGEIYHVDHMWCLNDGGPHWSGNLQIITGVENNLKGASVDVNIKQTIKESLKWAELNYD